MITQVLEGTEIFITFLFWMDQAPMECQHQAVYNILNELTDSEFLGKNSPNNEQLTYATMWLELEEET